MFSKTSKGKILAIDWDARSVRFVHAVLGQGRVRIDRMFAADVPAEVDLSDPESTGGFIRAVLDQQRIRTNRVLLDVPRDQALLTTLNLPAASPDEMPALVEFQIAKEIPFSLAEAVVDFALPSVNGDARTDVLVGTVRREIVAYFERTCDAAGLKLERLGLRPYANKMAVTELFGDGRYSCAAIVDVGPRLTEIDVIADGQLAFSRAASVAVPRPAAAGGESASGEALPAGDPDGSAIIQFPARSEGGEAVSDADRVVAALLVEVTRSLEAYRSQSPGQDLGMVVVGGATGVERKLAEAIGRRFGVPVELYNPARQFGWPEERGREALGFSASLGLVAGHAIAERLDFDFLHPKKTVTATERRLRKAPAVAAALVVLVGAAIAAYVFGIAPKQKALAEVHTTIEETKAAIEDLEKIQSKVLAEADRFEAEQYVWIDELNRISEQMPSNKEIILKRIDMYHKQGRIVVQFEAKSADVAGRAVAKIDAVKVGEGKNAEQYFDAQVQNVRVGSSKESYPASGSIEVEIVGKQPS